MSAAAGAGAAAAGIGSAGGALGAAAGRGGADETPGAALGMTVIARNTAMDQAVLLVETSYTFRYPDRAPALPEPEPRWVPKPAPADPSED